jgi:hypothetical protein
MRCSEASKTPSEDRPHQEIAPDIISTGPHGDNYADTAL